jgi:hypothetical protein
MMKTPPGNDQALLRRIATTARRQRGRIGQWPLRIRVNFHVWHLIDTEVYTTNAAGRDLTACFTHNKDHITPGAAASIAIEHAQLLVLTRPAPPGAAPTAPVASATTQGEPTKGETQNAGIPTPFQAAGSNPTELAENRQTA